jgi:glycosyltransferase involved in cell wall biosynthesis
MKKILFTTPILEYPALGGPQLRIANSIKALNEICDLRVLGRQKADPQIETNLNEFLKVNCKEFVWLRPSYFRDDAPRLFQLTERVYRKVYNPRIRLHAKVITEYAKSNEISIIWFGYGNISLSLIRKVRKLIPEAKLICDTDSVWSRFVLRRVPYVPLGYKLYVLLVGKLAQRRESALLQLSDVVTAVSDVDVEHYQTALNSRATVSRFSNVVDLNMYKERPIPEVNVKKHAIYLAGTFGHKYSPMDYGCRWFLEDVLPLIQREIPDAHFYIAGTKSLERFGSYVSESVTILGRLDDLVPFLCKMDVSIVPLFFESGTRYKILEASICGVPVASTSLGAEGLEMLDYEHLLIADDASEFSKAVIKLLVDSELRRRLVSSGYQKVSTSYSVSSLKLEGELILNSLEEMY